MTISSAAAVATHSGTTSQTTLSVTSTAVNDLWIVTTQVSGGTIFTSGVSGGNATGWTQVLGPYHSAQGYVDMWLGTMTSAASGTITFTYSASIGTTRVSCTAKPFHSTRTSPVWLVDRIGVVDTGVATTTITWPTLAPSSGIGELYYGRNYGGSVTAGSTSGFTYETDGDGALECYDVSTTGSVSPTATQTSSTAANWAVIVSDALPRSRALNVAAMQRANVR